MSKIVCNTFKIYLIQLGCFLTGKVPLKTSKAFKNKFERGQTDIFSIDAKVGEVQKIR